MSVPHQIHSAVHCPEALRIIGEDLEFRGIKTFLLQCEGDLFVVEGGYQSPPAPTAVSLHYAPGDFETLDSAARERKNLPASVKNFLSLSEILWAVASYVTAKGARLLAVSNNDGSEKMPAIKIEYEMFQGDRVIEDLTGSAIYELCVTVYKRRAASNARNSRYTRFSALSENG